MFACACMDVNLENGDRCCRGLAVHSHPPLLVGGPGELQCYHRDPANSKEILKKQLFLYYINTYLLTTRIHVTDY